MIDLKLDKASFLEIYNSAKTLDNKFINGYLQMYADLINLKSFVRVKKMNKGFEFWGNVYIEGGTIPQKIFTGSFDDTLEQFSEKVMPFGYHKVLTEGYALLK
jgi:V/A-type H+-transporting ATPase subunit C